MATVTANARRMLQLFARMRAGHPGPAFLELKQLNLSFTHLRAMQLLAPDLELPMKDLAEQMQLTPPSVTALTRRLVQTELVHRTTHADDSRVVLLSLTDKGRTLHEQIGQEHTERMVQLLQGLTDAEQQQFLDLLERAVSALQTAEPIAPQTIRVAVLPTRVATPPDADPTAPAAETPATAWPETVPTERT